jgi:hypothetical protein
MANDVQICNRTSLPAVNGSLGGVQAYLDEVAPVSIVGRMLKFNHKQSNFITTDDEAAIPEEATFIALCDQTMIGWVKFNEDAPPDRVMGVLYDGFRMPRREELGDTDPSLWATGLDGKPADPWQHHQYLVLQSTETAELFTFVTSSATGRRAVGNLLHHYNRMVRTKANDELPVVKLKTGGFNHKDDRIGWVPTPVFAVVGRAPRDSAAKPDTSISGDMSDSIPF